MTIAIVVTFFLASVTHAAVHRGLRWAVVLVVVTAGGGLAAEAVGVRTGFPFGDYSYTGTLGPTVLDVPAIVPLAWTMMAYPLLLAGRRISRRFAAPIGAFGLAAWDVFLDPQMVDDGRWRWADPTPGLPGVEGVPLTNYAGWLLVGLVMMVILHAALPRVPGERGAAGDAAVLDVDRLDRGQPVLVRVPRRGAGRWDRDGAGVPCPTRGRCGSHVRSAARPGGCRVGRWRSPARCTRPGT